MKSLSYLNKYFRKYSHLLILGFLFIAIQNYFYAKMPVIIGDGIDQLSKKGATFSSDKIWNTIMYSALIYIVFSIVKGIFLFLTRQTIIVMSRKIEFDLKNEVYDKYQELDYSYYKSQSTGDLMNRIAEDVSQVRQYLGPGIMYTVNLIISLPFICYQMFKISWEISLYALAPLPIMTLIIYFVSNRMNQLSKDVQGQQSKLSTIGQETFSGIRVIKAYLQEKFAANNFEENSKDYHKKTMRLVRTNALFMPTIALLIGLSSILSIYLSGIHVIDSVKTVQVFNLAQFGKITENNVINFLSETSKIASSNKFAFHNGITTGNIITFVMFIYSLTWPFASVGWVTSIIQRAAASQQRINEFLKIQPEIVNNSKQVNSELNELKFSNVSFQYKQDLPIVLKNIDFKITKGQTIGIIGRTGSGKTTLIQLLVRQLDPTNGTVDYNNSDLKSINLDQFRSELAVVPQDVFLFSDSIKNNILFSDSNADFSLEEIRKAVKDAHVLHNIEEFEEQFDTLLGERGVNLSGGQKQRISIARALIRKPKLLILDDCLSAVDTETESIILDNLKNYTRDYSTTTVIVSHRVSSLRNADQIIVLENGSIAETGNHDELISKNGIYKQMYEQQLLEQEETE
ncbi:MAG: ABC transporter ATP-binding protein [Fluviicola sp.]